MGPCSRWSLPGRRPSPTDQPHPAGTSRAGSRNAHLARPPDLPPAQTRRGSGQVTALPLSCLLSSWVVMASLRGLAASMTGMVRVSTPAL